MEDETVRQKAETNLQIESATHVILSFTVIHFSLSLSFFRSAQHVRVLFLMSI